MNKQLEIFEPLIEEFSSDTKDLNFSNIPSIFLPHVMNGYNNAPRKIFYFGQDTKGWGGVDVDDLFHKNKNQSIKHYILDSSYFIGKYCFLNNCSPSGFWTLVIKLHLKLNGISEKININQNLANEYKLKLNDFGYGNMHSIQIQASFNEKDWNKISKIDYKKIKEKSMKLDALIHTIKAFNPDLIFIFNWETYRSGFLKELDFEQIDRPNHFQNHFQIIKLKDYNTHIIWTAHPRYLRIIAGSPDNIIDVIIKELKEKGIIH